MSDANLETERGSQEFDFSLYDPKTLIHDRREGRDRRSRKPANSPAEPREHGSAPAERRAKKERRRRIDPTTFEKQYTDDELEFMNAMQRFKELTGKSFPSHGEVLKVAVSLGYRRMIEEPAPSEEHCGCATAW